MRRPRGSRIKRKVDGGFSFPPFSPKAGEKDGAPGRALGGIVEELGHELILAGCGVKSRIHHGGTEDTEKNGAKDKGKATADLHG